MSQNETKDICMMCLSNIVVGVYMNTQNLPFSEELVAISHGGIDFVKNFKDSSNFNYEINVKLNSEIDLREYQL